MSTSIGTSQATQDPSNNEFIADGEQEPRNVVVTGFGLFRDHQLNPSWEAIKDGKLEINRPNLNIITKQVNVSYEEVDEIVSTLWKEYNPILMVHIGLAAHEGSLRIEEFARHGPYLHDDVLKEAPHKDFRIYDDGDGNNEKDEGRARGSLEENLIRREYSCRPCDFESSRTCLDVDKVCDKMMQAYHDGKLALPTKKSYDAGLYLCEYIYQKSLRICSRCVFIHVPDTIKFQLVDIRAAIKYAIEELVDQVTCVERNEMIEDRQQTTK